jgi:hypothetical protein
LKLIAYLLPALICAGFALAGCGDSQGGSPESGPPRSVISGPLPAKGDLLFVLRGATTVTEGKGPKPGARPTKETVAKRDPQPDARLAGVHDRIEVKADAVEWFTARPKRKAGIAAAHALVDNWKGYGFDEQPPNATVTGPDTDAVVELRKPQKTPDGVAFEAVGIRGELPPKRDAQLSLFIDSSEWKTDMHVYVKGYFCAHDWGTEMAELRDPEIITAPGGWSIEPPNELVIDSNTYEPLFTANSKSGSTKFEVTYKMVCDDNNYIGTVTLKGSVPDSLSSDSFSCNPTIWQCSASQGGGYHVDAHAAFDSPVHSSDCGSRPCD